MVKIVSKTGSTLIQESKCDIASGAIGSKHEDIISDCNTGRSRARSRVSPSRSKGSNKKRRPTLIANSLHLAHVPMSELGDIFQSNRAGLILGEFLDLDQPQLTSEVYSLLGQPGVVICFFNFWLAPLTNPGNAGLSALQICKRSFNILSILSLPQAFSENLIDQNIHEIMKQVSEVIMSSPKPYVSEPVKIEEVEHNFHHLKMGVLLLLGKRPSVVRSWLLTTRHAKTKCMRPPIFGILNHLHHPGALPLLRGLLFDLVEGLASHTTFLEAVASHGFIEEIWRGIWKENRGEVWLDLLLFLLSEGGKMVEAGGLFRHLGSVQYGLDLVEVFKLGNAELNQNMIDFIDGIQDRPLLPLNEGRSLSQITFDIFQNNLDSICSAFILKSATFTSYKAKFLSIIIKSTRIATFTPDGCNFSPLLFKVSFDWVLSKGKCSILHSMFLSLVDSLVGSLANQSNPVSAAQSAIYLLVELNAARRASDLLAADESRSDLGLTLHLFLISLSALYKGIKARSDPPDHSVTSLRLAIESCSDFHLLESPPSRDPALDFSTLPKHLSFTGTILAPPTEEISSSSFLDGLI